MSSDPRQTGTSGPSVEVSVGALVERLSRFDGPPEQFLAHLLALQCGLAAAAGGAILRPSPDGKGEAVAVYPTPKPGSSPPPWVGEALKAASEAAGASGLIKPLHGAGDLYGQPAQRHLVMLPIRGGSGVRGMAAFLIEGGDARAAQSRRDRLELTMSLLSLYEMRLTLQRRQADFGRLRTSLEVLAAVNEHDRFQAAAMSLCNEMASRWQADRVSVGFLKGRYVHLKALSHTEKFSRKMKLVQDVESAMEECLDQDIEVLYPSDSDATFVNRSAGELSSRHGPTAVLSLPLRRDGDPVGVVTIERASDQPFSLEEVEVARLTCDPCTARLAGLHTTDRWVGARAAAGLRKALAFVLGPKHTWVKVVAMLIMAAILFVTFVRGQWRAQGSFTFEAVVQSNVSAPFDGYVEVVKVQPKDKVVAGETILAVLETTELNSQLAQVQSEYGRAIIAKGAALAEGKNSEAQAADEQANKAKAQIEELERKIAQASMTSRISGTVISPDLTRQGRFHVELGQILFEVAPLGDLRAELAIPEDEIADVLAAKRNADAENRKLRGHLAASSKPSERIGFTVERINPVAEVIENRNVFKVRVQLDSVDPTWMRPGMGGAARIDLGKKRYVWLWSRKLVNWVRMKLWI